jgi:hypothetical protein
MDSCPEFAKNPTLIKVRNVKYNGICVTITCAYWFPLVHRLESMACSFN